MNGAGPDSFDLGDVTCCPVGERCERCAAPDRLSIETAGVTVRVTCLTLCDVCVRAPMPTMTPRTAADRAIEHSRDHPRRDRRRAAGRPAVARELDTRVDKRSAMSVDLLVTLSVPLVVLVVTLSSRAPGGPTAARGYVLREGR